MAYAGDRLIDAAYIVPFLVVWAGIMAALFMVWCCVSLDKIVLVMNEKDSLQPNIVAAIILCAIVSVFTFILDVVSCVKDYSNKDLPSYYDRRMEFIGITIFLLILYSIFFLLGVSFVVLELVMLCLQKPTKQNPQPKQNPPPEKILEEMKDKCMLTFFQCNAGHKERVFLICISFVGSAILSLTAHFPSILMAWATDPFLCLEDCPVLWHHHFLFFYCFSLFFHCIKKSCI